MMHDKVHWANTTASRGLVVKGSGLSALGRGTKPHDCPPCAHTVCCPLFLRLVLVHGLWWWLNAENEFRCSRHSVWDNNHFHYKLEIQLHYITVITLHAKRINLSFLSTLMCPCPNGCLPNEDWCCFKHEIGIPAESNRYASINSPRNNADSLPQINPCTPPPPQTHTFFLYQHISWFLILVSQGYLSVLTSQITYTLQVGDWDTPCTTVYYYF